MDWAKATIELERKLNPANVKKASGGFGPKGDYIEGWHAIAEANRIFGFGGWSYAIQLTKDSLTEGGSAKGGSQWQAAYTCVCTVTVGETTRQDVGFGSGFAKNVGDAIEGATKEAATDALKRALRTFGNPFGLALYDKAKANVGIDRPPFDAAKERDRLKGAVEKQATVLDINKLWAQAGFQSVFDQLPEPMQGEVKKAKADHEKAITPEKDAA